MNPIVRSRSTVSLLVRVAPGARDGFMGFSVFGSSGQDGCRAGGLQAQVGLLHGGVDQQFVAAPGQRDAPDLEHVGAIGEDRKSTRLNSSHVKISYAVFCLK